QRPQLFLGRRRAPDRLRPRRGRRAERPLMGRFIQIVEVGPRDGLQNEKAVLEPAVRAEFVRRLETAGARRIEAVSFVHPKYVPQMAGAEEVMAVLPHEAGRSRVGLVLNGKGYDRALGTAVDEVNVAMSATDGFG